MTKGKYISLTPLAFALVSALSLHAVAGEPYINSSTSFDKDTVYVVDDQTFVVVGNSTTTPVEIAIADGTKLTLQNAHNKTTQDHVVDGSMRSGVVFSGGDLLLLQNDPYRKDLSNPDSETDLFFIRASGGIITFPGNPNPQIGGVVFNNASTEIRGDLAHGIYLAGGAASFKNGFLMTMDRSPIAGEHQQKEQMWGVKVDGGGLVAGKNIEINMIAGSFDLSMRGIWVLGGGDFQAESLTLNLDANNNNLISTSLTGLVVTGAAGKADLALTGDVNISIKNAANIRATARGMELSSARKYSFAGNTVMDISNVANAYGLTTSQKVDFGEALTVNMSQIGDSAIGVNATSTASVTAKKAVFQIDGDPTYGKQAVYAQSDAKVSFSDSLTTNADLLTVNRATIDVVKNFESTDDVAITAQADSTILVNSLKQGTVHFSGYTERTASWGGTPNSTISMNIGSGADGDDSYWNVTQASTLTNLSLAKNASLFFKVRDTDLDGTDALITVTGAAATAVELASGSNIALYGSGFDLEAGKTIQLIKSDKGIEKDGNALAAGDSLDDLKGDLTVIDIKSLIRATETGFSKDQYDLSMKTDELLIATIKEKAPAPTPDPDPDPDPNPDPKPNPDPVPEPDRPSSDKVNDQTNALMQSSIASAATMYAADELLIDSTMKSRQGVRQTGPFAAARVGKYDLDVTGDADTTVISGLLGYAFNVQDSEVGIFMEMGHGTYDTRTATTAPVGETKGDGKHNYVGFGVYGNYATPIDWLHVTGYVKGGWLRNEFSAPIAGVSVDFDRTSNYWGAHLGMYGEFQAAGKIKNRTFLNYFYDGRESESYTASGSSDVAGADFHFNSLNSHRAQLGSVFEYAYTSALRPYAALTYEYAFKADAKGRASDQFGDLGLNGTDLEGSTGIVSLGWTYQNEAKRFEFDLGVNGYTGKRQGVSAQAQAAWKF
ncbi:autotransporter outer membrane beta-barrel domain-containing protein [Sutterella wadsworthensis]|uniref:autotransporter outer membrane beta-barrel domain-containing protein n=1 Tax=Sutterella wadsworthensis TaxID=40545 RepID=UPI00402AC22E